MSVAKIGSVAATAEQVFGARRDLEVSSAGTNNDAENPLTADLVEWDNYIFVMNARIAPSYNGALRLLYEQLKSFV